jgi:predicted TIM-barrel fold metal-dependent hydrolase
VFCLAHDTEFGLIRVDAALPSNLMELIDVHTHFLSFNYFRLLTQQRNSYGDIESFIRDRARERSFETPPVDPVRVADKWVIEMDRKNVSRMVVHSAIRGDESSVKEAMRIYPDRFIGVMMTDPYLAIVEELIEHAVRDWGFRGIALYPSLHRFRANSSIAYPIYHLARRYRLAVFVYFGKLKTATRRWWGLNPMKDWHFSDPSDLHQVAADFPTVNFIVPRFGAGTLTALLRIGLQCPNVYIDTSGSNTWIDDQSEYRDLKHVFQRTLEVFGPGRMLFGTGSDLFPRGWRSNIHTEQWKVLRSLGVSDRALEAIFAQNARQLFGLDRDLPSFLI